MAKRKNSKSITIILGLILLIISGALFYLAMPFIKNTDVYKNYQANRFITYTSTRAEFSFKYPNSWPISIIPEERLKSDNEYVVEMKNKGVFKDASITIDNIDFQEEWIPNAGGPRYGWINVSKEDGISSLDDYIQLITKNTNKEVDLFIKGGSRKGIIPAPEITYTTIGGVRAISVKDKVGSAFSNNLAEYVVVKNGFVYRFAAVDSSRFLENKDANWTKFQKIIESVKFIN